MTRRPALLTAAVLLIDRPTIDPIVLDGHADAREWSLSTRIIDTLSIPYTELRVRPTSTGLAVLVYAADAEIRPVDQIVLRAGALTMTATPAGLTLPVGVNGAVGIDGSLVNGDDDEEWLVELRIPWRLLPESAALSVERRDVAADGRITVRRLGAPPR